MIPKNEKKTYETFGNVNNENDKKGFSIKQSKEAFRILSSGVYSDKVLAVIRELSSNALDAHIEAGTQGKPFDVHLPNSFEPWFKIRDYGTGLSNNEILNLYTTYFDSTKASSNDVTGMMGIGSKSPFAYTDQFTVTSYYKGKKSVYSCFITDGGLPQVKPSVLNAATDQPDGLEVYMPVESKDFSEFKEKAKELYRFYIVYPNVTGNTISREEKFSPKSYGTKTFISDLDGNRVTVFSGIGETNRPWSPRQSDFSLQQGSVVYPIDTNFHREAGLNLHLIRGVLFEVPLGAVNVTASREHLEYDKNTTAYLSDLISKTKEAVVNQCIERIVKVYNKVPDNEDPRRFSRLVNRLCGNLIKSWNLGFSVSVERIREKIGDPDVFPEFRNLEDVIKCRKEFHLSEILEEQRPSPYDSSEMVKYCKHVSVLSDKSGISGFQFTHYDLRGSRTFRPRSINIRNSIRYSPTAEETIVVINDGSIKNYRQWSRYNFFENKNLGVDNKKEFVVWVLNVTNSKNRDELTSLIKQTFGQSFPVYKMEEALEAPPKKTKQSLVSQRSSQFKILTCRGVFKDNYSKDPTEGGVYVRLYNGDPVNYSKGQFHNFIQDLSHLGVLDLSNKDEVVGIPASIKKVPETNKGWVPFEDFVKEKVIAYFKTNPQEIPALEGLSSEGDVKKFISKTVGEEHLKILLWRETPYDVRSVYTRNSIIKKVPKFSSNSPFKTAGEMLDQISEKDKTAGDQRLWVSPKTKRNYQREITSLVKYLTKDTTPFFKKKFSKSLQTKINKAEKLVALLKKHYPLLGKYSFKADLTAHYVTLVENYLDTET